MATEYEVKFQKKGYDNPIKRKRFFEPSAEKAEQAWIQWIYEQGEHLRDYIIIGTRECTGEPITLEVKDVKGDLSGKL